MVRALKSLETQLVTEGHLKDELPSFLIECLVYNVPDDDFNHKTYMAEMRAVLASIFNATLSDERCKEWLEVNWRKYLFRSTQAWTRSQAHALADAAWERLGLE